MPTPADCRQDRPADHALREVVTKGQILTGLGGVGKTQLAANLAHRLRHHQEIDLLVWVSATSRSSIVTAYAQAAADITGVDDTSPERAAGRFLAWLASTGRSWLIVLDDLADPDDLTALWPPVTSVAGRTVVTTRRRDAALTAGRQVIDVGLFTAAESVSYLHAKLVDTPHLDDDPAGLAADLGHLPVALAQAVAYMKDRRLACSAYRRRFATRQLDALRPLSLPDQHRAIIAATWNLSVELADRLTIGIARPLLELAALLDPHGIPTDLFTTSTVTSYCTGRLCRPVQADDTRDALHVLHQLSLADLGDAIVRVHALIQRAVRESTERARIPALARTAADALIDIWPEIEHDATTAQTLRANTAILRRSTDDAPLQPDAHFVLIRAARSLGAVGLVGAAASAFQELLDEHLRVYGSDHPDTLAIRANVAYWRGQAGDPAGAASTFRQLLADCVRVFGADFPATLSTRANAAYWQGEAGDPAGAVTALEQLLADQWRILGPDHPQTLGTRASLAHWRGKAGDPAGAATAFAEIVTDQLRLLGPDHPKTLTARHNLAHWRGKAGDPAGAGAALVQVLIDRLRVLGPDHPQTLGTRHSVAHWHGHAGDPAGAAALLDQIRIDQLRVLGADHPDTLTTLSSLAYWRGQAAEPSGTTE